MRKRWDEKILFIKKGSKCNELWNFIWFINYLWKLLVNK